MGMTVRFNPRALEASIEQIGERAIRGMSARMQKIAFDIRDRARDYAPVKSGLLERSIDVQTIRKAGRNSYVVFIDLDAIRSSGHGELGDYALVMEGQLHPYGRQAGRRYFRLGPGSIMKAAGGKKVGGRFLARAVKDVARDIPAQMLDEVRRVLGSARAVPMNYQANNGGSDE